MTGKNKRRICSKSGAALVAALLFFLMLISGCSGSCSVVKTVDYVLCDDGGPQAYFPEGSTDSAPFFLPLTPTSPLRDGYVFRGWYRERDYSGGVVTEARNGDTLYARWEPFEPTAEVAEGENAFIGGPDDMYRGFLPYVEKFDAAYEKGMYADITLSDTDELAAYCDYVQYKYVGSYAAPAVTLDYEYEGGAGDEIERAYAAATYASYVGLGWSSSLLGGELRIFCLYPNGETLEASSTFDTDDRVRQIAPLDDHSVAGEPHDFAIDDVATTMNCRTSNQLFYAVMVGARPDPEPGSSAELMYAAARERMTEICVGDMSDVDIAHAVYDDLVLNVTYDEGLTEASPQLPDAMKYDAFFLEGVFVTGRAVCDGISKAMTLMCGIEGLPCVRVTGDEHAWNKVYVDGEWYISDATFGDTIILKDDGAYSVLTHAYFLTSEAIASEYSNADTYTSRDYDAPTDWGYYFRLGRVVTAADEPALIAELRAAQAATNAPVAADVYTSLPDRISLTRLEIATSRYVYVCGL